MKLCLQVNYLQITTTFNKTLIFQKKHSNIQSQQNYFPRCVSLHKHMIHIQWEKYHIYWSSHYYHNTNTMYVKQLLWQHNPIHGWLIWSNIWSHFYSVPSNVCYIWLKMWKTIKPIETVNRKTTWIVKEVWNWTDFSTIINNESLIAY